MQEEIGHTAQHREGPHAGVLQDLQLPGPVLVGGQRITGVAEAVHMDTTGVGQRQEDRPRCPELRRQRQQIRQRGPGQQEQT